jgi:hypothetical protein
MWSLPVWIGAKTWFSSMTQPKRNSPGWKGRSSPKDGNRPATGRCSRCRELPTKPPPRPSLSLLGLIFLNLSLFVPVFGQNQSGYDQSSRLEDLASQHAWEEILRSTDGIPRSADESFFRGLAFARVGRLEEAEQSFEEGLGAGPKPGRFLVELAGIRFKQKRYSDSRHYLKRALASGIRDPYVFDFLGTLYFLEGRLEAALHYWNRIGKPRIEQIRVEPRGVVDPIMLDRGLAISQASVLDLQALEETRARLENLGIFSMQRYQLEARPDARFNLTVHLVQAPGLTRSFGLPNLLSLTRELPFQTVHADFTNIGSSARSVSGMLRWEPGNQRFSSTFSSPLSRRPRTVFSLNLDGIREDWDVSGGIGDEAVGQWDSLKSGAMLRYVVNDRWSWSTGVQLGHYRLRTTDSPSVSSSLRPGSGFSVQSIWQTRLRLLELPEQRMRLSSRTSWDLGRDVRNAGSLFSRLQSGVEFTWLARDQLQVATSLQVGKAGGTLPLDQLFRLGLERDPTLMLRGHAGRSDGLKGRGPVGTGYILANFDLSRRLYTTGLFSLAAGPFVDSARVFSPFSAVHQKWLWDTGIETRLSLLNLVQVAFSYGFDTRNGERLFFARLIR